MKRVVVGLSGGVDSSVAAFLLKRDGYEVIGMFMKNWHDESVTISDECPWIDDSNDALLIAQQLDIPFQVIDLSVEYKQRIVDYMFNEYARGRTPNPDVLCNREIKFDAFLKAAMSLGADYVATGHYCRKMKHEDGTYGLIAGLDPSKDQSYFLCQLNQDQLSKALFPIGDLHKKEVRSIAAENGLITANKKDSQGLCFVGKISLPVFLQQQLKTKTGDVIELAANLSKYADYQKIPVDKSHLKELADPYNYSPDEGTVVGQHQGAHYYTIGQRKGLRIGGRPLPAFVLATDTVNNIVYTGLGEDHPGLYHKALRIKQEDIHYLNPNFANSGLHELRALVRIRYRQQLQPASLNFVDDDLYILFDQHQRGITPGQFAAIYLKEELIASGVI